MEQRLRELRRNQEEVLSADISTLSDERLATLFAEADKQEKQLALIKRRIVEARRERKGA